ncbi:MAG: ATP-binding protein [Cellvibrionaceae bacterium]|nr:ATP-binding protein [Cellvibrionaceae bacterium]
MEDMEDIFTATRAEQSESNLLDLVPDTGLDLKDFYNLALQLCDKLEEIHNSGAYHGDLKSESILFDTRSNTISITGDRQISLPQQYQLLSDFYKQSINADHLAPEQMGLREQPIGQHSDIFSLGLYFCQLLCGRDLYAGLKFSERASHLALSQAEALDKLCNQASKPLPSQLKNLLAQMLSPHTEARPPTAAAVNAKLERLKQASDNKHSPEPEPIEPRLISTKNYGREQERELLDNTLEQLGSKPQILLVTGPIASGKTHLFRGMAAKALARKAVYLNCRAFAKQQQRPFLAIGRALQDLMPQLLQFADVETWRTQLANVLPNEGAYLLSVVPELDVFLPNAHFDDDEAVYLRAIMLQQSLNIFFKVVEKNGINIIWNIDDSQWLDEDSIDLIQSLIDAQHQHVLFAFCYRIDSAEERSQRLPALLESYSASFIGIDLEPFSEPVVASWLSDVFAGIENAIFFTELITQLLVLSRGRPRSLYYLLEQIVEQRLIVMEEGLWQANLDAIAKLEKHSTHERYIDQLKELAPEAYRALAAAAVIMENCVEPHYHLLSEGYGVSASVLLQLRQQGMLRQYGIKLAFPSHSLFSVVQQLMPRDMRYELHIKLWQILRAEPEADLGDWICCLDAIYTELPDADTKLQLLEHNYQYAQEAKRQGAPHGAEYFISFAMQQFRAYGLDRNHPIADDLLFSYGEILAINGKLSQSDKYFSYLHDSISDAHEQDKVSLKQYKLMIDINQILQTQIRQKKHQVNLQQQRIDELWQELLTVRQGLIESEKMASLGGLVAGVTHEINNPIGISITGMSHFIDRTKSIKSSYYDQKMTKTELEGYFDSAGQAADIIFKNLLRAADLIRSFKRLSSDQSTNLQSRFYLIEYIKEILLSLSSQYRKRNIKVELSERKDFKINSYAGWFSQVFTNLIMNSLIHAFDDDGEGEISIDVDYDADSVTLVYRDNGRGIPQEKVEQVFEPFYTTNREGGGTGLGLSVVREIIEEKLEGKVICNSIVGEGVCFEMVIPRQVLRLEE